MIAECMVCAYEIDGKERMSCLSVCGHNNMCSLCTLRIRALHRNVHCVTCKRELEHVICTEKPDAKFEDYPIWGDSIGSEFVLDQKSQMFFPTQYHKDVIQKLWIHKCKVCNRTFRDMKSLRAHVNGEHNMHICLHCVENKHDFPAEQKVYTQKQYETHLREGDQDGSQGHPNCEFCRKRYYDTTALFVHLSKDHYTCHLCEKADIKFKYYNDYKCLEEHFAKAHILCDDPACLAKKFIVFDNEIDYEVHNRKYHPTFTVKRSSTIKLDFKIARPSQANPTTTNREDRAQKTDGTEEESHDHPNHSSGRFEGGTGGRARDGEWQVELQPITSDPRDANRNAHITPGSLPLSMPHSSSSDALAEEFPTLQGTSNNSGPITLTNKWVSMSTAQGAKRGPKKADFPALQSKPKASMSAKLGGGNSGISTNSVVSSMLRDYDALSNTTSGSVSNNSRAVTGSLGDWARIKVDKKSNAKASASASAASGAYYSANPPMSANYEDSLAMALAASLSDAYKTSASTIATAGSNAFDDFTPAATKPAAYPPPPPQSSEAYPTLSSTAPATASTAKSAPKKKAPSNNNWGEALSAVGMTSTSAKNTVVKKKLTVIKASTSSESNLNKLGASATTATGAGASTASADGSGVKWESMKPLAKVDDFEYRIGSAKSAAATVTSVSSASTNDKKYGGWVKMGGATNGSVPSQVDRANVNTADYPSLGSAKRK
eukprot:CAMPEP_0184975244 /NCGR_PEP_ID=MMETSP1098-20130426/6553_1 /TAXON_ID=89044 /ORGANISM="Spumella elongata, Strain CCAP 955/1" /LENGTH=718 /DNA_ID=CAMNT_0027497959 /DNA_START=58 /DNA_END=2214 /DNA_ORIENTATION=+